MGIKIYDTMSRCKRDLIPLNENTIKMYACGVTVYDKCHVGHARQAIVYDIIMKYLEFRGYSVIYVRNYTDVDDKIIACANKEQVSPLNYANNRIIEAESDFLSLGVVPAHFSPRVSDNIDLIIDFIKQLIDKGHAYSTQKGDVFFSVRTFLNYGRLSNKNIDELEHGVRKEVEIDKKDPLDFALWKSAKEGEISWQSPWGNGRPGWHIECSAMSMKYLGESFDIHGGGKDLIFPHHENEIAQSESLTGKVFANYWVHNGLITINGQKMSKSSGNYISIEEVVGKYHPEVLRFYLISSHYSSDIDISYNALDTAEKRLYYFYKTLQKANSFINSNIECKGQCLNNDLVDSIEKSFIEAMDDDFNTALAIANLSNVYKYINELLNKSKEDTGDIKITIYKLLEKIMYICGPLGILKENPNDFVSKYINKHINILGLNIEEINNLISLRHIAKSEKNYALADEIREKLKISGIVIQDKNGDTEWDIAD